MYFDSLYYITKWLTFDRSSNIHVCIVYKMHKIILFCIKEDLSLNILKEKPFRVFLVFLSIVW